MFRKILIGVDGREGGQDALALARQLAGPDSELVPVHLDGSAARGLHKRAIRESADLLVIGATRHGLIARTLGEDDTRDTLRDAPCAVAVAPAGYASAAKPIVAVGVGYDESPESETALTLARELTAELSCKLATFRVYDLPEALFDSADVPASLATHISFEQTADALAEATDSEGHLLDGDTVNELTARTANLDLLVVGHRERPLLGRALHRSTSHRLARTADCPLLVAIGASRQASAGPASSSATRSPRPSGA